MFPIIDDVSEILYNEWAVFPKAVSNGVSYSFGQAHKGVFNLYQTIFSSMILWGVEPLMELWYAVMESLVDMRIEF